MYTKGSSGVVYPYPVIESIANEKTDHEWNAVFIENEYIKVMVLPELVDAFRWLTIKSSSVTLYITTT